jgi:phosphopantothenoylcysteine synthetase/decarboxylase
MAAKRTIILGVTGSIAAYKSADLASKLKKLGHDVFCVMTKDAMQFITPLTLETLSQHPVTIDLFEAGEGDWPTLPIYW